VNLITALSLFWSFDHHACDTLFQRLYGGRNGVSEDSILVGTAFAAVWLASVSWRAVRALLGYPVRNRSWQLHPPTIADKVMSIVLLLFGLFVLDMQAASLIRYVDVCHAAFRRT
jgi:hypothetical protein